MEQPVGLRDKSQLQVSSDKMPPWAAAEKHNLLLDLTAFDLGLFINLEGKEGTALVCPF